MPLFVNSNDWLVWISVLLGGIEGIVLLMIIIVLLRWAKRMVQFMELMEAQEQDLRLRLAEEWATDKE